LAIKAASGRGVLMVYIAAILFVAVPALWVVLVLRVFTDERKEREPFNSWTE
jgi:hypothetical protein